MAVDAGQHVNLHANNAASRGTCHKSAYQQVFVIIAKALVGYVADLR